MTRLAIDGSHEFSLNPDRSNMLQSNEMVTPGVDDFPEISKNPYSDFLDAKDLNRIGSSENASASMDDVEELTLKNYDGENLTIVGTSNNRERTLNRRKQWQNLYQNKGKSQATSSTWEETGNNLFSGLLDQNQPLPKYNHDTLVENLLSNDDKRPSGNNIYSSGGIRTKILSKSGFSEYFIKSTLIGKGVIHKSPNFRPESGAQSHPMTDVAGKGVVQESQGLKNYVEPLSLNAKPSHSSSSGGDGINLREWLERVRIKANKFESMHIFRQVLDLVEFSHSRGVFLQELRPSYLKLSKSYQVVYLGSSVRVGNTSKHDSV